MSHPLQNKSSKFCAQVCFLRRLESPLISRSFLTFTFSFRLIPVALCKLGLLFSQGDGAWAGWLYTLRLSDNRSFTNISGCEVTLPDLRPSTFYSVQVAAYSAGGGRGRWSLPSRGKTLARSAHNISLLWGSGQGLYATDTLGEELTLLTGGDWGVGRKGGSKQIQPSPNTVASLTWWESTVFYALSNGSVFVYG